jgi:hypothetical protein
MSFDERTTIRVQVPALYVRRRESDPGGGRLETF